MLSVGRGIADITGEPADCGMLGYGKTDQRTAGIHLRLRSRAFVFDDGGARLLLVVAELPMPMQNVTDEVLRRLADSYGDTYTEQNTLITATHTHAGPAVLQPFAVQPVDERFPAGDIRGNRRRNCGIGATCARRCVARRGDVVARRVAWRQHQSLANGVRPQPGAG